MIIQILIGLIITVFGIVTLPISIPSMPDSITEFLGTALEYLSYGVALLSNYFDMSYLLILFGIVVMADAGFMIYKLAMWVLRKIPFLGIK